MINLRYVDRGSDDSLWRPGGAHHGDYTSGDGGSGHHDAFRRARFHYYQCPRKYALRPGRSIRVQVVFHPSSLDAEQVSWSFARELLATGLVEPSGIGDVRVWPWSTPRGEAVALALSSPDGNALFEISRGLVARFLKRTYALVPRGKETDSLDVTATVTRLLTDH